MKAIKLLSVLIILSLTFTSCNKEEHHHYETVSLEDVVTRYDLWYVDFNRTAGYGDVPFLSKAFTLTFQNGRLYANNNIVGIGHTGDGYGIQIGSYSTYNGLLKVQHSSDGHYSLEVIVDSAQSIRLHSAYHKVTYYLEGYSSSTFDYDQVFYDNIEYFLQEYMDWEKTYTSVAGVVNEFDDENFLAFTSENTQTFYSSVDDPGTAIIDIEWDYSGSYELFNVSGYDNLKILKLRYSSGDTEEFELSVINDSAIKLYHNSSGTTYEFDGRGYIQYKSVETSPKSTTQDRKRFKVNRKTINRKPHTINKEYQHTKDSKKKIPKRK